MRRREDLSVVVRTHTVGLLSRQLNQLDASNAHGTRIALSSVHLFLTTVITSACGYLYWIGAARFFNVHTVGTVSTLVSATLLLTTLGSMGVGLGLAYILPGAEHRWSTIVNTSLLAVAIMTAALSVMAALVAASFHLEIATILHSPLLLFTFVGSSTLWTMGYVIDQILTIERATSMVLLRNALSSVVRLSLVPLAAHFRPAQASLMLYGAWGFSAFVSIAVVAYLFLRYNSHKRRFTCAIRWQLVREVVPLAITNHMLITMYTLPDLVLPLFVSKLISTEANAYFYTTWMVAFILFTIPTSTSTSLFAHSAAQQRLSHAMVLKVLLLTLAAVTPLACVYVFAHHLILSLFGEQYARHSGSLLIALACTSIPMSVCGIYITAQRLCRAFTRAFSAAAIIPLASLGSVLLVARHSGLTGVGVALVLSYSFVALCCLIDWGLTHGIQSHSCQPPQFSQQLRRHGS